MRPWTLAIASLALLTFACSNSSSDADESLDGIDSQQVAAPAPGEAPDCSKKCAGARSGSRLEKGAETTFKQQADCTIKASEDAKYHLKKAGDECQFPTGTFVGDPVGAFSCEEFSCGETGKFLAAACVSDDPNVADSPKHCADRETACRLAMESEDKSAMFGHPRRLCK